MESEIVPVALVALCVATMALIWQVSRLTERVDDLQECMYAVARWLTRMEADRLSADRQKDGGHDDED